MIELEKGNGGQSREVKVRN